MAYSFPLQLSEFFEGLPIQTVAPDLGEAREFNQTGAGDIVSAALGPRLWRTDVSIRLGRYTEMEQIRAKLDLLREGGSSFLIHSIPIMGPQYDPKGLILGGANVTLSDVRPNNKEISLAGLPVDYTLTIGDMLSFTYGSSPVRYAMHRVVKGGSANTGNALNDIEVRPHIRPGYTIGAVVRLIKPIYKAKIMPNSVNAGTTGSQFTSGISFTAIQTLGV